MPLPPSSDAREIVSSFVRLRGSGDVDSAFDLAHEDVELLVNLSEDAVPAGGGMRGKANVIAAIGQAANVVDHLVWRPKRIVATQGGVRVQMEILYRHRSSGELLSGNCRMMFTVADGLITRIEEFHDRAMLEAFFRFFGAPAVAQPEEPSEPHANYAFKPEPELAD